MINEILAAESSALRLCEKRAVILAGNVANSATPHYRAKDINFAEAYKQAMQHHNETKGSAVQAGHIGFKNESMEPKEYYRVPMQTSLDGNSYDGELERKHFSENAIHFQAAMGFAQSRVHSLIQALKGE